MTGKPWHVYYPAASSRPEAQTEMSSAGTPFFQSILRPGCIMIAYGRHRVIFDQL